MGQKSKAISDALYSQAKKSLKEEGIELRQTYKHIGKYLAPGEWLCACKAIQAPEERGQKTENLLGTGDSGY